MDIKKVILALGLVGAVGGCASMYPYKQCRKGIGAWECRIAENWTEDWNSYFTRLTQTGNDCVIDIDKGSNYTVMIDRNCDRSVDNYMDDNGLKDRSEFGDKYDAKFEELKNNVGEYSHVYENWYEVKGSKIIYRF